MSEAQAGSPMHWRAGIDRVRLAGMVAVMSIAHAGAGAADPASAAQEAMAATRAACDAFRLRDIGALEKLLAPEFTLVTPAAQVQTRDEALAEVRADDPRYELFENHDMVARVYGETAVVQGITSLKGRSGGKAFAVDVRFTDTLVRTAGQWRIVVSHVTRIPPK